MIKIDKNFLKDLGFDSLPDDEKRELVGKIYEMAEARVDERLTAEMTDEQFDEFEAINEQQDDEASLAWIKKHFPHYEKIVSEELDKLKAEITAKTTTAPPSQDLFEQLGMINLSAGEKAKMSAELGEVVMDRVATRLEAILTLEQAKQFKDLLPENETAAFQLLKQFVPNYDEIVLEEMDYLRDDMLATQTAVIERLKQPKKP